jgi:DNA-binding response OmpR family regulator
MPITIVLIAETRSIFSTVLSKHYTLFMARSGKKGIVVTQENEAKLIILDAASLGTNGERICKRLRQEFPDKDIIHIHPNPKQTSDSPADIVLKAPLSARSLLNTIKKLISEESTKILHCGSFQLDVDRRILIIDEQETSLTPKQTALIEIFLRHPNQTLQRGWLMQQVWRTNYIGDTRTLNVHIRFVREVMEKDANHPRYIKTIRGVGYRFELDMP